MRHSDMFAWLRRTFDSVAGRVDSTVRGWVSDLLNGLYGYLHNVFADVTAAWNRFTGALYSTLLQIGRLADSVYKQLYRIIRVTVPAIINEYRRLVHDAVTFASGVYDYAVRNITAAVHYAERLVSDAINWIRVNLFDPLQAGLLDALRWITHNGAVLWDYITHPDKLAALLFDSLIVLLERNAWSVADRLGKFFISLIFKNLTRFITLIEDVLDAIL